MKEQINLTFLLDTRCLFVVLFSDYLFKGDAFYYFTIIL